MNAHELTALASDWLAATYPGSVIVPELSVADWGGARVDLAAITPTGIIGVEVKGEGDSPARLELQGHVYGRVCRRMWLLADESLRDVCHQRRPSGWGRLEVWEGAVRPWNRAKKPGEREKTKTGWRTKYIRDDSRYDPDEPTENMALCPWSMCGTLWRDELYEIARLHGLQVTPRAYVHALTEAVTNQLPMPTIHAAMIDALMRREWGSQKASKIRDTRAKPTAAGLLL